MASSRRRWRRRGRGVAADVEVGDPVDEGHEHDGEERADVDDFELFEQLVGDGEEQKEADGEKDGAARSRNAVGHRGWVRAGAVAGPGMWLGMMGRCWLLCRRYSG